jgi:hypothetical protein
MTHATATASLKAATAEYVNQYGIDQFITGQMTAEELAIMYYQVDELNGIDFQEAEEIIQGKINEFIANIENEDESKVAEFWENVSECTQHNIVLAFTIVAAYLSGKKIDTEFFISNYTTKSAFGRLTGLINWRLGMSRADIVHHRLTEFDAYEESITLCGTKFQVVTICGPNGNEASVNEI